MENPNDLNVNMIPKGITRLKRQPLLIGFIIFIGLMLYLSVKMEFQKSASQKTAQATEKNEHTFNETSYPVGRWYDQAEFDRRLLVTPQPLAVDGQSQNMPQVSEEARAYEKKMLKEQWEIKSQLVQTDLQEQIRFQKETIEATRSPIKVAVDRLEIASIETTSPASSTTTTIDNSELSLRRRSILSASNDSDPRDFLENRINPDEYLMHRKSKPVSRYEVKSGSVIPAALISGLNSDLPGRAIAQVTENVYDTVTGQFLLIPQGTRVLGEYDSQVAFGQNRLLIVWTRLIFPDGSSLLLERMQGVDIAGMAGFTDKVNNHYLRLYGNALLLSLVGAGYELANPGAERNSTESTVVGNISQQLAQTFNQTTQRNLNVQPTIEIRPGYQFNVMVVKDMILEDING